MDRITPTSTTFHADKPKPVEPTKRPKEKQLPVKLDALIASIEASRQMLRPYVEQRRDTIRQIGGPRWSGDKKQPAVPLNVLSAYQQIISRSLIAKEPRVMLSSFAPKAGPVVSTMQDWLNKRIVKIQLAETLQRWVSDALVSVGILKVALAGPTDAAAAYRNAPAGLPFVDVVDLDDFAFDPGTTSLRDAGYLAHRVRVPMAAAKAQYPKSAKFLEASAIAMYDGSTGEELTRNLGRQALTDRQEFEDMTDLWEIYLSRHRMVVVLACDESGLPTSEILEAKPWLGPDCGPYEFLSFALLPGNPMPKAPIMDLMDLHLDINAVLGKLCDQARRQKKNLPISGGAVDSAGRLEQAEDGEMFQFEGEVPVEISWGGPDAGNVQFLEILRALFDWQSGNLSIQGGLSPQSKTASQDKMLNENASASVLDKQDTVIRAVSKVITKLGWFYYHHPDLVMETKFELPGLPNIGIVRSLHPNNPSAPNHQQLQAAGANMRSIPWEELDLSVDPYSLRHQTPEQKTQELTDLVTKVVIPMLGLPQVMAQGVSVDMGALVEKLARLRNQPDLKEIVTIQSAIPQGGAGPQEGPGMPAETERTYTRRSMGGDSSQGSKMNAAENFFSEQSASEE